MTTPTEDEIVALVKEAGFYVKRDGRGRECIRDSDDVDMTDLMISFATLLLAQQKAEPADQRSDGEPSQ